MAEPRTVRADANALNSEEIAALLPHRYPFALVDRILDYEPGQWAIGRKCVSRNEEFFCGHFPGQPVMPGVLILEALAQTGAVAALSLPENKGKLALFGGIKNARFRKQVTPGDVLTLHCELVEQHGPLGSVSTKVSSAVAAHLPSTHAEALLTPTGPCCSTPTSKNTPVSLKKLTGVFSVILPLRSRFALSAKRRIQNHQWCPTR